MTNKYNLGDTIYRVDLSQKKQKDAVKQGVIIGISLSTTGYIIYRIALDTATVALEEAYIFTTLQAAKDAYGSFKVISDEANLRIASINNEVNMLRESIVGVPEFPQYAQK